MSTPSHCPLCEGEAVELLPIKIADYPARERRWCEVCAHCLDDALARSCDFCGGRIADQDGGRVCDTMPKFGGAHPVNDRFADLRLCGDCTAATRPHSETIESDDVHTPSAEGESSRGGVTASVSATLTVG